VRQDRDGDDMRWAGRQAVATVVVSATPGTVVVDVEDATGVMRLHALGSGAPSMEEVVSR
jgi:multisubunit Na+/H+ antiporter MnhE subunit